MAEDWALDVKKYVADAHDAAIAGIVRHCGIALRSRDASLVSFTDPSELATVRESFCRRKLGLTATDAELDAAIHRVGERMRADHTKNRVTVYYLLAEEFGKLGLFGAATAAAAEGAAAATLATPAATVTPAAPVTPVTSAMPAAAFGAVAAAASTTPAPVFAAAPPPRSPVPPAPSAPRAAMLDTRPDGTIPTAAIGCGLVGAAILIGALVGSLAGGRSARDPLAYVPPPAVAGALPVTNPAAPAAVAAAAPATPAGSGVVAQVLAGKPSLSVYFDTAKSDISPDFAAAAAPLKAWIDGHPGARLAVSGFNDPRGNAAFNATLSKNRAKAVAAALAAAGVPATAIDLVKPADTTDATTGQAQARRVDVVVRDAG